MSDDLQSFGTRIARMAVREERINRDRRDQLRKDMVLSELSQAVQKEYAAETSRHAAAKKVLEARMLSIETTLRKWENERR